MPLGSTPDEAVHFYRAFQVGEGHALSITKDSQTGGNVPWQIQSDIATSFEVVWNKQTFPFQNIVSKLGGKNIDFNNKQFVKFPTSAVYSPTAYIPQAVGINIARIIYPTTGFMVLLAKLINLAVFILLVWWAIKIAKHQRWVYVCLALFPIIIQQATSLSTDVITTGGLFIFIATIHNIFIDKQPIDKKTVWQLLLSALLVVFSKPTNIVVLLPLLFIPVSTTRGWQKKIKFVLLIGLSCLLASVGWYALIKARSYNLDIRNDPSVNMASQLRFSLSHPTTLIKTLLKTFVINRSRGQGDMVYMSDFITLSSHSFMSWFFYRLPLWSVFIGYGSLVLALLHNSTNKIKQNMANKRLLLPAVVGLLTFIISMVSIAGVLYLMWTPVGNDMVLGIQGRYIIGFIPLLIPLGMYLQKYMKVVAKESVIGIVIFSGSLINLLAITLVTFKWFY